MDYYFPTNTASKYNVLKKDATLDMFDEFLEYEAMTFALGGDLECPDCEMGILIPVQPPSEDAQRLVCDVCDEVFELADED
ncbi:MAG: hypothetical protein ACKVHR_17365 [Pirellulales bacterium]